MMQLNQILSEVLVKNKKTGNVYNVVKMNPQTQEKPTPKDIKKANVSTSSTKELDKKDKEQIKQFKDLGLNRDKAVKAHSDANEYAKKLKTKADIVTGEHTIDMINLFRKAKVKPDDATLKLLVKLQKTNGEAVTDTKKGKVSYFLFDGSKYEMNLDGKNKTATTKSIKENTIKLKDLLEAYNPAEAFHKKVSRMTDRNEHSEAAVELAIYMDDRDAVRKLQQIKRDHDKRGSITTADQKERDGLVDKLLKKAKKELSDKDYKLINSSF